MMMMMMMMMMTCTLFCTLFVYCSLICGKCSLLVQTYYIAFDSFASDNVNIAFVLRFALIEN